MPAPAAAWPGCARLHATWRCCYRVTPAGTPSASALLARQAPGGPPAGRAPAPPGTSPPPAPRCRPAASRWPPGGLGAVQGVKGDHNAKVYDSRLNGRSAANQCGEKQTIRVQCTSGGSCCPRLPLQAHTLMSGVVTGMQMTALQPCAGGHRRSGAARPISHHHAGLWAYELTSCSWYGR